MQCSMQPLVGLPRNRAMVLAGGMKGMLQGDRHHSHLVSLQPGQQLQSPASAPAAPTSPRPCGPWQCPELRPRSRGSASSPGSGAPATKRPRPCLPQHPRCGLWWRRRGLQVLCRWWWCHCSRWHESGPHLRTCCRPRPPQCPLRRWTPEQLCLRGPPRCRALHPCWAPHYLGRVLLLPPRICFEAAHTAT